MLLASGSGTLTQAVLEAFAPVLDSPATLTESSPGVQRGVQIAAIGTDKLQAGVLDRAASFAVPTFTVLPRDFDSRPDWDAALLEAVRAFEPDWVVSAGFMRILSPSFIGAFRHRIINTHPALLPSFPGAHAVRDALAAGVKVTGTTIHLVDEGVDTGPVIAQFPVEIRPEDTQDSLHERIRAVERRELVALLAHLAHSTLHVDGRQVTGYPLTTPAISKEYT